MTRDQLSDGDREILAELEANARCSADDLDDLLESADCLEDVFGELLDCCDSPDVTNTGGLSDENGLPY
jgi:hypothetical protein